jgi:hypothetical protein
LIINILKHENVFRHKISIFQDYLKKKKNTSSLCPDIIPWLASLFGTLILHSQICEAASLYEIYVMDIIAVIKPYLPIILMSRFRIKIVLQINKTNEKGLLLPFYCILLDLREIRKGN